MASPKLLAALLLAVTLAAAPELAAAGTPLPWPLRNRAISPKRCPDLAPGSTAAYDILMSTRKDGSKYSDFLKAVKDWKMTALLKKVSKGKVLIVPTNAALSERFVRLGLYKQPFKVPRSAIMAFRKLVETDVAFKGSQVKAHYGCGPVYVRSKYNTRFDRLTMIKYKKAGNGQVMAVSDDPTEYQFSILGTGYNTITGFPLSMGISSLDPGMTLTPIFTLTPDKVRTLAATGGACKSQFSTSTYSNAQGMKDSIKASLSINGNLGSVAFQGSASFSMVSETSMSSQTVTTNSGASVHLGGYSLAGGPAAMELEKGFIKSLEPLLEAAVSGEYDIFSLRALLDNYGTHYIKTVWYGGLASVTNQMTSSSLSSLSSLGVSVSIAAQASMVQLSANVDYNKESTQAVQSSSSTFSQTLIPASVPIALTGKQTLENGTVLQTPQFIDCVEWTNNLRLAAQEQLWKAPVHYQVAPIVDIFSFTNLFPDDWKPYLGDMQKQVYNYMVTCGYLATDMLEWERNAGNSSYSACPDPPAASLCVVGTYRTKSGACNTCFGDGTVIGPNCNETSTITCTAYACYCKPKFANDPDANCVKLAPNAPAPPAPSMVDLSD